MVPTTIRKVARSIAADRRLGWNYIVQNCIVCRSLSGVCLQGLLVDRTSRPGAYVLWAFTQTWFEMRDPITLSLSFKFTNRTPSVLVPAQAAHFIEFDDDVHRVVFASPNDPVEFSPKAEFQMVDLKSQPTRLQLAIIRAWDRKLDGLLPELIALHADIDRSRPDEPYWNRYREAAGELVACLRAGRDPRTVIEPWNHAARAKVKIEPVARMRLAPRNSSA